MQFDKTQLLEAFDAIGSAAIENHVRLEMAVYRGSALMLASSFRFSTEDVDIAELPQPWPEWLRATTQAIALRNDWAPDWLNDAVTFHLSPLATRSADHLEYGSFPRTAATPGLSILVPTPQYMLALKLKPMRMLDPVKGQTETDDILALMTLLKVDTPDGAVAILARYFPKSAEDSAKQRFLLKHIMASDGDEGRDAPRYAP